MKRSILAGFLGIVALAGLGLSPANAEVTIFDIQLGIYPAGSVVQIDGVVVTAVGKFGFFVQEPNPDPTWGRQWSGIFIFNNGTYTLAVHKGDVVNVKGTYAEYFSMSELDITPAGSFTQYVGPGTIPDPVPCLISEVNDAGAYAEAYESVLIRVDRDDNTLYADSLNAFSEWYLRTEANLTGDSLLVDQRSAQPGDDFEYDVPPPGTLLSYAQGVLIYDYSQYKIAPRNCETDLGTPCKPKLRGAYGTSTTSMNVQFGVPVDPGSAANPSNYLLASGGTVLSAQRDNLNRKIVHLSTTQVPNAYPEQVTVSGVAAEEGGLVMDPDQSYSFRAGVTPIYQIQYVTDPVANDDSPLKDQVVTVAGRLTAIEGNYYYMQDGDGTAWRGLYSRVAKTGSIAVGDSIQVSGVVREYFSSTQLNYISGVDNFVKYPGTRPVKVNPVEANAIPLRGMGPSGINAEPWESCLIKLSNASLQDSVAGLASPYFGEWLMRQVVNPVHPDTASFSMTGIAGAPVSYDPCANDRIDITGILRYAYNFFRIAPRTGRGGDIVVLYDNPTCVPTAVGDPTGRASIDLEQNLPNPFGGSTAIRFLLPQTRPVSLEILDVGGRLVKILAKGSLAAGEHTFHWDGTNHSGRSVASGTYFYRLRSDGTEISRKMVLIP